MALTRVNVPGVARLPAFCHATVAGNLVFVSGTLGAAPGVLELVPGGVAAETVQTLRNIEAILAGCGCTLADLVKVTVYLTDMTQFGLMNQAYLSVLGDDPPARVTSGCTALALNAAVEMDCVAVIPS
jgi:reactive intermediate/imine deaminase